MGYSDLRLELGHFYADKLNNMAECFYTETEKLLDNCYSENMSAYEMKRLQYKIITENFDPVVFYNSPFYYETGTMSMHCDGARELRGHRHIGGWTYWKNEHMFCEQNEELWKKRCNQGDELFYLICGPYNDTAQHFAFNYRPVFGIGLEGIYKKALEKLKSAQNNEEKDFLLSVSEGMLCLKKAAEKFSEKAKQLLDASNDCEAKKNLTLVYETAKRVPWKKPESFYEALNTYAFLRKVTFTVR